MEVYPFFENALRAESGRSVEQHQRYLGELMAAHAAVAKAGVDALAVQLAIECNVSTIDGLHAVFRQFFPDEEIPPRVGIRFAKLVEDIGKKRG